MKMELISDVRQIDRRKAFDVTNGFDELCMDTDAFNCLVSVLSRSDSLEGVEKGMLWSLSETMTALNARLHELNRQLNEALGNNDSPEPTLRAVGTN